MLNVERVGIYNDLMSIIIILLIMRQWLPFQGMIEMKRIYTSLDNITAGRLEKYNTDHPGREIEPTKILRAGIDKILKDEGY